MNGRIKTVKQTVNNLFQNHLLQGYISSDEKSWLEKSETVHIQATKNMLFDLSEALKTLEYIIRDTKATIRRQDLLKTTGTSETILRNCAHFLELMSNLVYGMVKRPSCLSVH